MPLPSPVLSTALSESAVADLVYFQQHESQPWIRVGHTRGSGRREDAQDEYEPVAVIQGSHGDEDRLHELFATERVTRRKSRSVYEGDRIHDYVSWLLKRGFAGRDRCEAEILPSLPFAVWSPEAQRNEHRDGQLSFDAALPPRDRINYARSDLAHLSSESDDWFTPPDLIDAARTAMGGIDLDPSSCPAAQRVVRATQFYTKAIDGLRTDLPWNGRLWVNPPYGRGESSAGPFIRRLVDEYTAGNVTQAITCLNIGAMSAQWFRPIFDHASSHLICDGRPNFWREDKGDSSPTKGIVCSYFGPNVDDFEAAWSHLGRNLIVRNREKV